MALRVKRVPDAVKDIREAVRVRGWDRATSARYALIVGAGFSHPSVPLTRKIVREEIGDFYYLQDQEGTRDSDHKERDSILFWREFNAAASTEMAVQLDSVGLPSDAGAAYRSLFAMQSSNPAFYKGFYKVDDFLKDFLRYCLNPGWARLNDAHFLLGCLLELQQWGWQRASGAFARRIFTSNFDTLLQQMLQTVGVLYTMSDRPAAGFKQDEFAIEEEEAIHLVYVHGSILRRKPAKTDDEIMRLRTLNATLITPWLEQHGVVVIGYGGWDDGIMEALASCRRFARGLYWCDLHSAEDAATKLPPSVLAILESGPDDRFYVPLGEGGASRFMAALYQVFAFDSQPPGGNAGTVTADPIQRLGLHGRGSVALERHKQAFQLCGN